MKKILMSACLVGNPVRYNGEHLRVECGIVKQWMDEKRIVTLCPEVSGGLPTPRPPAEIVGGNGLDVIGGKARVMDVNGHDISTKFLDGAKRALAVCKEHGITTAILAESSPSCGSGLVYNGKFEGAKIEGAGVTAALLRENGIRVFNQHQIEEAMKGLGN